jgi:hypothetical protein
MIKIILSLLKNYKVCFKNMNIKTTSVAHAELGKQTVPAIAYIADTGSGAIDLATIS